MNVVVNSNNSIKLCGSKIIYIDPYEIQEELHDADYIFCTHSHYDHFSPNDIEKILKKDTKIITVKSAEKEALKLVEGKNLMLVEPENKYIIENITFLTTYAYNVDKPYHPRENKWVGFIINLDNKSYYIAGDTDVIEEMKNVNTDVAFLPVGGTYTMNYKEAAKLANCINAKTIIPTHYGSVAGSKEDGENFKRLVKNKNVIVML